MDKKKVITELLLQALALFAALVMTVEFVHLTLGVLGEEVTSGGLLPSTDALIIIGLSGSILLFSTLAHFLIYSKPKLYWYLLIALPLLISLVDWRFFLIQLGYIFFGFAVGSIIRITSTKIGNTLGGKPFSAPTRK